MADGRIRILPAVPCLFGRHLPRRRKKLGFPIRKHAEEMFDLADRPVVLIQTRLFQGSVEFALEYFAASEVERFLLRRTMVARANGHSQRETEALGAAGCGIAAVARTHEQLWYERRQLPSG